MKKARAMYIPAGGKTAVWGPVDHNVLPEGYPYKEQGATILNVTHEFPALRAQQFPAENAPLEAGKEYTITVVTPNGNTVKNVSVAEEISEGRVRCIFEYDDSSSTIGTTYDSEENTFSLIDTGSGGLFTITIEAPETIHTMAEEFLPALTSPNGTKYQLTVADDGTLSAVAVS